jgi:hypothetical protein
MALWCAELPGGGFSMGEAADEHEARLMIAAQQRGSVTFRDGRGKLPDRWRWTVVLDDGKTSHGWADSEREGWWFVREALNRPHRGVRCRAPRGLFELPPV